MSKLIVDPTFQLGYNDIKGWDLRYANYRAKWSSYPKHFIVDDFPIHLDLELNTTCNLKCIMCFQSFDPPEPEFMSFKIAKRLISEGADKGLCSIKFQYRGEPLLYSFNLLIKLIKYAKSKGIIDTMFNTNATLLDRYKSQKLISSGIDKIICSIDGCTPEVYESIRIGGEYAKVRHNIFNFRLERGKKRKPILRVQMVEQELNKHQLKDYIYSWSQIADQVGYEDCFDYRDLKEDDTPLPNWHCAQLWQRLIVRANGDVHPCCFLDSEVVGNIHKTNIEKIWKQRHMKELRKLHQNGQSHKIKMCRRCYMRKNIIEKTNNGKNK